MKRSFVYENLLFVATQLLAIFVGTGMINAGLREQVLIQGTGEGVYFFIASLAVSTLMMIVLLKYLKGKFFFQFLFGFLIFSGAYTVFGFSIEASFPALSNYYITAPAFGGFDLITSLAFALAIGLALARYFHPVVWLQNFALVIALAGVAPQLAMLFTTKTIILVLIVASVYDYIAVFKTKHMVSMFTNLMNQDAPLALIIPEKGESSGRVDHRVVHKKGSGERRYMLLGTGDLAFPTIFVVSVFAEYGIFSALAVMAGSLIGLYFDQWWVEKNEKPMPALPAISAASIALFLLSLLVI